MQARRQSKVGAHSVQFIALISLSIGLLNLLPVPMLDGGHLMYYLLRSSLWEAAPSDVWLERIAIHGYFHGGSLDVHGFI
jgi:regulator of sigma E protease